MSDGRDILGNVVPIAGRERTRQFLYDGKVPGRLIFVCSPSFKAALDKLGIDSWMGGKLVASPGEAEPRKVEHYVAKLKEMGF